jgi:myo-inositol-hexaphosphate 3-phosphohydrolase
MNIKDLIEAVKFKVSVKPQDEFMKEVAEGIEKLYSDMLSDYDAALRKNNATTEKNSATELTDNEIINAFEELIDKYNGNGSHDTYIIVKNALDLITRQNEQIEGLIAGQETLQKYIAEKDAEIENLNDLVVYNASCATKLQIKLVNAKSEAVKECLEWALSLFPEDKNFTTISRFTINQKLKEMVGDTE